MTENGPSTSSATSTKGPWPLIAVVVAAFAVMIWAVPSDEVNEPKQSPGASQSLLPSASPTEPNPAEASPAAPETSSIGTPALESTTAPVAAAPAAPARDFPPGGYARQLIAEARQQGQPDLQALFVAAFEQHIAGRLEDAYLLYFFAAREGHAEAAMRLAEEADPKHFRAGGIYDRADEIQAHKWYQVARDAGHSDAENALNQLRTRIEKAAAAGDERAHRIMLQWK